MKEIPKTIQKMELESLQDLINLISDSKSPSIYYYKSEMYHIYFILTGISEYYEYRGMPLLIYVKTELEPGIYLKYQINRGPNIKMTDRFEDANAFYIGIVKIKKLPCWIGDDF